MTAISPSRQTIFQQDTAYQRSVSEVILSKFGAQSNFINTFQVDMKEWILNGSFSVATGLEFWDGPRTFFFNSEIVAVSFYQEQAVSGTTRFDVRWLNAAGVDQGTIFSTKPQITNGARRIGFRNLITGTNIAQSGVTLPVLSKTTFNEGETIYLVLESAMTQAFNAGLTIFYRPIN